MRAYSVRYRSYEEEQYDFSLIIFTPWRIPMAIESSNIFPIWRRAATRSATLPQRQGCPRSYGLSAVPTWSMCSGSSLIL